jgi:hypothetical protein
MFPSRSRSGWTCSIHPWEAAWLVVTGHPYVALSQTDSSFFLRNLPVGKWTFRLWHERARWLTQVTLDEQKSRISKREGSRWKSSRGRTSWG